MIKPTIGRIVWYQPPCAPGQPFRDQPFAAQVAYVWNDTLINIGYLDQNGTAYSATSVTLLQDDDEPLVTGNFAQWMPYQTGRAAIDAEAAGMTVSVSEPMPVGRYECPGEMLCSGEDNGTDSPIN